MEQNFSNTIPIDYKSDLPAISINLNYHTTNQEKLLMFPIDPYLANTRTVTSILERPLICFFATFSAFIAFFN